IEAAAPDRPGLHAGGADGGGQLLRDVAVRRLVGGLGARLEARVQRDPHHARASTAGAGGPTRRPAMPPSPASTVPVVEAAWGLARYATAWATSAAVTRRPSGCRASSAARSASGSRAAASSRPTQGVSTVPGFTQLTRTPSRTRSAAI